MAINHDVRKRIIREPVEILLDDLDLSAKERELKEAVKIYKRFSLEVPFWELCRIMGPNIRPHQPLKDSTDEMVCFILHLGRKGRI